MKTIKNFKQFVNENQDEAQYLNDEEIEAGYNDFSIRQIKFYSDSSGFLDIVFPHGEDKVDNFIIYDNNHVAFDNWYPENVYFKLVKYIADNHSNPKIKTGIYAAYPEYLKESVVNESGIKRTIRTTKDDGTEVIKYNDVKSRYGYKIGDKVMYLGKEYKIHSFSIYDKDACLRKYKKDGKLDLRDRGVYVNDYKQLTKI